MFTEVEMNSSRNTPRAEVSEDKRSKHLYTIVLKSSEHVLCSYLLRNLTKLPPT